MHKMGALNRILMKALLTFLISGTIIYIVLYSGLTSFFSRRPRVDDEKGFLIDTPGCQIPRTPIFPDYYKRNWHVNKIPNCSYEEIFTTLTDEVIVLSPEYKDLNCCLHEITPIKGHDDLYNISNCKPIKTVANVRGKEMLFIKCGKALNFHATLPTTPQVQAKLDHWESVPVKERPPSVLIFGVDTVSRSHAHRSLPKTMELMKGIGFTDFKGYHSIAAGTFHNFIAFLMGLHKPQVLGDGMSPGCAPQWRSPYDACPLIWKDFAEKDYVTMFMEDGGQTFNWGGQLGFQKRPTDFYVHNLFQAIAALRRNISNTTENCNRQCLSREGVPEFLVHYMKRFVRKFQSIPFFTFTWFADPFHGDQYTLGSLDGEIHSFLDHLSHLPNFLERTLIIFLGDHGDRYGVFQSKSHIGYVERGLPALFMRIPEMLKNRLQSVEKTVSGNSEALTSGFDVHHTLKHILFLFQRNSTTNFEPVLKDRSSLLIPVDLNRTCDTIHVYAGSCVCGSGAFDDPFKNQFLLTKVMQYLTEKMNAKFSGSKKYNNTCQKLNALFQNVISAQILKKTNKNSTDTLVKFKTIPGDAIFEVKVKIYHGESNFYGCEMIGEFQRVSSYGNQSDCVEIETEDDKRMKEFCLCTAESLKKMLKSGSDTLKSKK